MPAGVGGGASGAAGEGSGGETAAGRGGGGGGGWGGRPARTRAQEAVGLSRRTYLASATDSEDSPVPASSHARTVRAFVSSTWKRARTRTASKRRWKSLGSA